MAPKPAAFTERRPKRDVPWRTFSRSCARQAGIAAEQRLQGGQRVIVLLKEPLALLPKVAGQVLDKRIEVLPTLHVAPHLLEAAPGLEARLHRPQPTLEQGRRHSARYR